MGTFVTIARAVRDIYRHFKKDDEVKAIDKAMNAIEANPNIKLEEAKETYQHTMMQTLGEERARPIVLYTDVVENFFPSPFFRQNLSIIVRDTYVGSS